MGKEYGTALALAAYSGKEKIVSLLLERGADINLIGGNFGTALGAAARDGNGQIVSLLLERGANVNSIGGIYETALCIAASTGNGQIVSLLLERGADINTIGGIYGTVLSAAANGGNGQIVSLLLERGADINSIGGVYGTVLGAAAHGGNDQIVSLLLERGADINSTGGLYGTALGAAADGGNGQIVSLLLERGADINSTGGMYGTALGAAAYEGNGQIVSLLLERGADINTIGGNYVTALGAAIHRGNGQIVSLLVDRGADIGTALRMEDTGESKLVSLLLDRGIDINAVGGEYGSVLAAAVFAGKTNFVKQLLDRGANINAVGGKYGTALGAAIYRRDWDMMVQLLTLGADIHVVGGEYGTALGGAVYQRDWSMVLQLLTRGADINVVGGEYGTALGAAAYQRAEHIVLRLLDRGADINVVGGNYGTALCAAAYLGKQEIVKLLLRRGANLNIGGGKYGTPLCVAAYRGHAAIVDLLLNKGADPNVVGGKYGTALVAAVSSKSIGMRVSVIVVALLFAGADISAMGSEYGAALAAAVFKGRMEIVSLLLGFGADVLRVGGSYSTTSGTYPSALDVAYSEGSKADHSLVVLLRAATTKQNGCQNQPTNPNIDPANNIISRPPFPMPYMPSTASFPPDVLSAGYYAGGNITPAQADVPCRALNEEILQRSLATLVGLHEGTIRTRRQWIRNDVRYFVACNFDFGLAYAAARIAWKGFNDHSANYRAISNQRHVWHKHAQILDEARSKAIKIDTSTSGQEVITLPYSVMPRRLWDLKSNRVINFQMLHAAQPTIKTPPTFWAVSHSWTSDMSPIMTAINQRQWPVPLPKGINLDNVRSELLTLGAEYLWVDVVCLRQQSTANHLEQLQREEWRLDVPTIGNIYRAAVKIVRYFNGLGVDFSNSGWDDSRHWLQRAWTLQEIASEYTTINGGIARDRGHILLNSQGEVFGKVTKLRDVIRPVIRLAAQVDSPRGCEVYNLAREMFRRHASQPIDSDKISGLVYLLRTTKLPCYDERMTSEDFWEQCFHLLPVNRKAEILFDFPYRGSGKQWSPTWAQILNWPVRDPAFQHVRSQCSPGSMRESLRDTSFLVLNLWSIPHAVFSETSYPGEYKVKIGNRLFGFYQPYLSQNPINVEGQPVFTLAIADFQHTHNWVVCEATGRRAGKDVGFVEVVEVTVLKKVGVIRTDAGSELLVGGENGKSLLQKMDCLFV